MQNMKVINSLISFPTLDMHMKVELQFDNRSSTEHRLSFVCRYHSKADAKYLGKNHIKHLAKELDVVEQV